jgi:hypothetical protein
MRKASIFNLVQLIAATSLSVAALQHRYILCRVMPQGPGGVRAVALLGASRERGGQRMMDDVRESGDDDCDGLE